MAREQDFPTMQHLVHRNMSMPATVFPAATHCLEGRLHLEGRLQTLFDVLPLVSVHGLACCFLEDMPYFDCDPMQLEGYEPQEWVVFKRALLCACQALQSSTPSHLRL